MKLVEVDFNAHKGLSQKSLNVEKLPRVKVVLDSLQFSDPRLGLLQVVPALLFPIHYLEWNITDIDSN